MWHESVNHTWQRVPLGIKQINSGVLASLGNFSSLWPLFCSSEQFHLSPARCRQGQRRARRWTTGSRYAGRGEREQKGVFWQLLYILMPFNIWVSLAPSVYTNSKSHQKYVVEVNWGNIHPYTNTCTYIKHAHIIHAHTCIHTAAHTTCL